MENKNIIFNNDDFISEIVYNQEKKILIIKYRLGNVVKYENLINLNEVFDLAVYLLMKQYNMSYEDLIKNEIISFSKQEYLEEVLKKNKIKNFKIRKTIIPLVLASTLVLTYLSSSNLKKKQVNNQTTLTPISTILKTKEVSPVPILSSPNPTISNLKDIQYANNLIDYKFYNNIYQVIDTKCGYKKILAKVGRQTKDACLVYSGRYASFIFNNSASSISSTNGKTTNALTTVSENKILQIMAKEILEGRPCIIQVNGTKQGNLYSRHFVTVVGINKNYDLNRLKQSDFLIMDPGSASLKILDVKLNDNKQERFLLSGKDDTRAIDYDYLALVYNNPTEYVDGEINHIAKY